MHGRGHSLEACGSLLNARATSTSLMQLWPHLDIPSCDFIIWLDPNLVEPYLAHPAVSISDTEHEVHFR